MLNPNYVEVNETRLDYPNRNKVIQTVLDSVAVQPNYDALSKDLQRRLEAMYGPSWTAVVGTDLQWWSYFYVQNPVRPYLYFHYSFILILIIIILIIFIPFL